MNKLKAILLIYVLCNVIGCGSVSIDDCYGLGFCSDEKVPAYANESEIMVRLVVIVKGESYEKFIAYSDTLHSSVYYTGENAKEWYVERSNKGCETPVSCDYRVPVRMELYFLDNPEKCLIFDGPIEHDEIDMRSWGAYKKEREIQGWRAPDHVKGIEYIYTITPQHRAMAKEEFCP